MTNLVDVRYPNSFPTGFQRTRRTKFADLRNGQTSERKASLEVTSVTSRNFSTNFYLYILYVVLFYELGRIFNEGK